MSFVVHQADDMSWPEIWARMSNAMDNVNYKSSCPWKYVYDNRIAGVKPKLLTMARQTCTRCCVDLFRSNATHMILNPKGICRKVFNRPHIMVLGYTCTYAHTLLPVTNVKRNEDWQHVDSGTTRAWSSPKKQAQYLTNPISYIYWNKPTSKKYSVANYIKQNKKTDKYTTVLYTTILHQHLVSPVLINAQFNKPTLLQSNNAQLRPGLLNGMGGQPPRMPQISKDAISLQMKRNMGHADTNSASADEYINDIDANKGDTDQIIFDLPVD